MKSFCEINMRDKIAISLAYFFIDLHKVHYFVTQDERRSDTVSDAYRFMYSVFSVYPGVNRFQLMSPGKNIAFLVFFFTTFASVLYFFFLRHIERILV